MITKLDYVKGRAILDLHFRNALFANPYLIAQKYDVSVAEVEEFLATFDEAAFSSYAELAQERLEESAEYQKAL